MIQTIMKNIYNLLLRFENDKGTFLALLLETNFSREKTNVRFHSTKFSKDDTIFFFWITCNLDVKNRKSTRGRFFLFKNLLLGDLLGDLRNELRKRLTEQGQNFSGKADGERKCNCPQLYRSLWEIDAEIWRQRIKWIPAHLFS